jgi:crotonobetainyl-CoA:carnitine CoA-transferase CaiB-like acyl-CoA transferase
MVCEGRKTDLPLEGVQVLEIASVLAAPFAGHMLELLGADVIKVEPPGGDPLRKWGSPDGSGGVFGYVNSGKRSVTADLSDPAVVARLRGLLPSCDVVLCSGRPGTLARHGLGPHDCLAINPDLVVIVLTGFGACGPLADRPAYDSVVQSLSGLLHAYGVQGDVVSERLPPLGDLIAGLVASQAALAGLVRSARGRGGCVAETSLYEAMCSVMGTAYVRADPRAAKRSLQSLIFQLRCADGVHVTVQLSTSDQFWRKLCAATDPELAEDGRFATYGGRIAHYEELHRRLAKKFASRPSGEWDEVLAAADVPAGRILAATDAVREPQLAALGMLTENEDGEAWIGAPWQFNGRRPPQAPHAPSLGEDNELLTAEPHRSGLSHT